MRQQIVIFACLCSALVYALPLSDSSKDEGLQLVQIPLGDNKELDILSVDENGKLSERSKRTIGILRELFPELTKLNSGDNSIDLNALNEQLQETIRVARQAASENSVTSDTSSDQDAAESKSPAIDELTLDAEDIDGDDRNKRFLNFGFGGSAQGGGLTGGAGASIGGGGSGAGSGNFLFDIIRLFTGSVQTPQGDERANAPASSGDDTNQANAAGDGYTEGIPGPVTRLVVLANRGLANLIQDLILRIAATSERLVNFKARLITSLI